jgi:predicted nuclease of predicted toxin-antitoxin system
VHLKLDENLGRRCLSLFQAAGHDTATVASEGLCSAPDAALIGICRDEQRCLVTLDLDFGNPLLFKPSDYSGIAVLRLPRHCGAPELEELAQTLIAALAKEDIRQKLWIIGPARRVRVYQEDQGT